MAFYPGRRPLHDLAPGHYRAAPPRLRKGEPDAPANAGRVSWLHSNVSGPAWLRCALSAYRIQEDCSQGSLRSTSGSCGKTNRSSVVTIWLPFVLSGFSEPNIPRRLAPKHPAIQQR